MEHQAWGAGIGVVVIPDWRVSLALGAIAAIPGLITALLAVAIFVRQGHVKDDVAYVAKQVDGNNATLVTKLETATAAILEANKDAKYREGFKDGGERK